MSESRRWIKIRAMEYTKSKDGGAAIIYRLRYYLRNDGAVNIEMPDPDAVLPDRLEGPDDLERAFGTDDILHFCNGGMRPRTEPEFDQEFLADLQKHNGKEISSATQ